MTAFADQVALVSGAAQGLGRSIATLLARQGATVYLADLNEPGAEIAAAALRAEGLTAPGRPATWPMNPRFFAYADRIASERGRLDVLINNAGGWRYENIREVTLANWDWTFRVNLLSMFIASRACMDMMIERRYGRIVNISSTDGYRPKPTLPVYAAAKAAVVSLTRTFAENSHRTRSSSMRSRQVRLRPRRRSRRPGWRSAFQAFRSVAPRSRKISPKQCCSSRRQPIAMSSASA